MECKHCGQSIQNEWTHCPFCGELTYDDTTIRAAFSRSKRSSAFAKQIKEQFKKRNKANCPKNQRSKVRKNRGSLRRFTLLHKKELIVATSCFGGFVIILVLFLVFGICHHDYVNGQCVSCGNFDEEYCSLKYQQLTDEMENIRIPQLSINEIIDCLCTLPKYYKDVAEITAQATYINKRINDLNQALIDSDPSYSSIQQSYMELCERADTYEKWDIAGITEYYLKFDSVIYSFLEGEWENSAGYSFEMENTTSDVFFITTNLPSKKDPNAKYSFHIENQIVYYTNKANKNDSFGAYKILQVTNSSVSIYCYSNSKTYVLQYKDNS